MSNFEIPESNDPEWQSEMLRMLAEYIDFLRKEFDPEGHSQDFRSAHEIITALEEYMGQ